MQQYFWDKPLFKNTVTIAIPLILTFINEIVGDWFLNSKFNLYKILVIIIGIFYVWIEFYYFKQEDKNKSSVSELKNDLRIMELEKGTYEQTLISLITIFSDSANSIGNMTETIANKSYYNKAEWNFKRVATGICEKLYDTICSKNMEYSEFSVNIMIYDTKAKGKERNVKMIAHKSKYPTKPTIFLEKLPINKFKDFFAVKLFSKNKQDIIILDTPDEINQKFIFKDDEHPNYTQYVGIPIHCNGNQMVSLLQICAFNDSKIGDTKTDIMDFVCKCIIPFTHFALLAYNIETNIDTAVKVFSEKEVS